MTGRPGSMPTRHFADCVFCSGKGRQCVVCSFSHRKGVWWTTRSGRFFEKGELSLSKAVGPEG